MLSGRTVLIVEEEFLIALDIQAMLEALLAGPMLFARSTIEARQSINKRADIDLAIVEIGADSDSATALIADLRVAGIAVILTTTDSTLRKGHPDFPGTPVLVKPMIEPELSRAVALAAMPRTSDCAS